MCFSIRAPQNIGMYMECIWNVYGMYMEYVWNMYGIWECIWILLQ